MAYRLDKGIVPVAPLRMVRAHGWMKTLHMFFSGAFIVWLGGALGI